MMITKVLAERIEENLEGMEKQLAKEVVGLEEEGAVGSEGVMNSLPLGPLQIASPFT